MVIPAGQTASETLTGSVPLADQVPLDDNATASHRLAKDYHDEKDAAQLEHGGSEDGDLGWNEDTEDIGQPLIDGLSNETLWTLIRRFNKQLFFVKVIQDAPVRCFSGTERTWTAC